MTFFDELFALVPKHPGRHAGSDDWSQRWSNLARAEVEYIFGEGAVPAPFGPFGVLDFPYRRMGTIDTLNLFGFDELIMFAFYHVNRGRYRKAVDFGANLGLHSVILARCGFEVRSFEPDPVHLALLKDNLVRNAVTADVRAAAVSYRDGETEFVRVKGNTTGNHIKGAKANPYGDLDIFKVTLEAAGPHLAWADFAKIDIEGHEATLLTHLPHDTWTTTDALAEVGTKDNALEIFEYFKDSKVNLFAQKAGWAKVKSPADMPESHREGSLFISSKSAMPWLAD